MRHLVGAELRKLTSTRWVYLLAAGAVALAVVTVVDPARDAQAFEKPFSEHTFVLFTSLLSRILVFVMGLRMITDELRHGTIVPTFLVTPRRQRVVAAKTIVAAAAGAGLAVVAWAAMVAAASMVAAQDGATLTLGAGAARSLAGTILAGAGWGVIGLGVGMIVRSQIAATAGGLVWMMALEDGVRGWLGDLGGFLPGQAGLALSVGSGPRVLAIAGATLATYAAIATAGALAATRRDVT